MIPMASLLVACSLFTLAGVVGVWRIRRRGPSEPSELPAISVLKPLRGVDDDLEANLETFFRQDHGCYELVFGVEGLDDPAVAVVRNLRELFPDVPCRLVVHDGGRGINPKVSNLRAMIEAGSHDLVLISDSNVSAPPDYLRAVAARMTDPKVGLVTNLFRGTGEEDLGALLDNLHLDGAVAGGVAASALAGPETIVVGKSMAFRRSELERLGGLGSVATVLAEDYVIGRMFSAAGYRIEVCDHVLTTETRRRSVGEFVQRQLRWNLMRSRLKPVFYALEPLTNPVAVGLAAVALGAAVAPTFLWLATLVGIRDGVQGALLGQPPRVLVARLAFAPLKDLLMLGVWAVAPFRRHVTWRGRPYRVSAGTRLYAPAPMAPPSRLWTE